MNKMEPYGEDQRTEASLPPPPTEGTKSRQGPNVLFRKRRYGDRRNLPNAHMSRLCWSFLPV